MVLRIHPAPPHYGNRRASSPTAVGTSLSTQCRFGFQLPCPSNSPVGRSKLLASRRQVPRWPKSWEDMSPLPFLAFSIVGELFCIIYNLTYLGLYLSFVWAEMFGNSSCQSHGRSAAPFHGDTVTDSSTKPASGLDGHTQIPAVACKTWLESGRSSPAWSPVGMVSAPEGKGMEQALNLEVGWGQWHVLGSNGRRYVY